MAAVYGPSKADDDDGDVSMSTPVPPPPKKHAAAAAAGASSSAGAAASRAAAGGSSGKGHVSSRTDGTKPLNALPSREVQVLSSGEGKKSNPVLCVRWNKEGEYCMIGGRDRIPRLWNPHKGTCVQEYKGIHGYEVNDIKITADNSRFASVGGDKLAYLWDVASAQVLKRYRGHTERINSVAFSDDPAGAGDSTSGYGAAATSNAGAVMITGSYDKTVRVWDNKSHLKDAIATLSDFTDSVTSVAMTDHTIVAGCVDGRLRTYDIRMGKRVTDYVGSAIVNISLSADRQCVLATCLDGTLKLFDVASGELLNSYSGHKNSNARIESCLSYTDAHVISGSEDHSIYIWSLVEAELVTTLTGHTSPVVAVAYHPSTACLLSGSTDGTARVWK